MSAWMSDSTGAMWASMNSRTAAVSSAARGDGEKSIRASWHTAPARARARETPTAPALAGSRA